MKNDGLDVTRMDIECKADGDSIIKVWVTCTSREDIDDVIAWLRFAKQMTVMWDRHRKGPS